MGDRVNSFSIVAYVMYTDRPCHEIDDVTYPASSIILISAREISILCKLVSLPKHFKNVIQSNFYFPQTITAQTVTFFCLPFKQNVIDYSEEILYP